MKITENTTVNLTIVMALVGGVIWLSTIYSLASSSSAEVLSMKAEQVEFKSSIKTEQSEMRKDIMDIKQSLARIEGKLEK